MKASGQERPARARKDRVEHERHHHRVHEDRRDRADGERDGETAHRAARVLIERRRREQDGHVRVDDRRDRVAEPGLHGKTQPLTGPQFLADALERDDVPVRRRPDGEDQAREPRQRQGRVQACQNPQVEEHHVEQTQDQNPAEERPIVRHDQHDDRRPADQRRPDPGANGVAPQGRPDRRHALRPQRDRQAARAQHERQVGRLFDAELSADLPVATDPLIDGRGAHDVAVEHNRHAPTDRPAGKLPERPRVAPANLKADRRAAKLIVDRRGVLQDFARKGGGLEVRLGHLRVGFTHRLGPDEPELQDRLLPDQVLRPLLLFGGEARQFDDDAVRAGGLNQRLGDAALVDAVFDNAPRRLQVFGRGVGRVGLQHAPQAALQVEAQVEGRFAARVPRLPQVQNRGDKGREHQ